MKPTPKLLAILGSSLLAAVTIAKGQSTWTGGTSNSWGTAGNWNPSGVPGTGANTVFTSASASGYSIVLGEGNRTVNSITFNSTTESTPYTINLFDTNLSTKRDLRVANVTVEAGNHSIIGHTVVGEVGNFRPENNAVFNIASGASLDINARIRHIAISDNHSKTGGGTLIFSANNGASNAFQNNGATTGFTIEEGVLRFVAGNAFGNSANKYVVSSGAALELAGGFTQILNAGTITLSGNGIGGNGALRTISGNNSINGTGTGGVNLADNASIGADAGSSLTIAQVVSGPGNLTKVGSGTLTLSGANTYTGATIISSGTLEVRGSIATSSGITNNAALVFNSGSAQSYGNAIGGSGTLTKQGAGTLTLAANNSYSGATTISEGVLQIGGGGTTGTLGGNSDTSIASGAELRINRSADNFGYSYSGELSGDGTVNILSSRRFNFQTNNQTASGSLAFTVDGTLAINTPSGVTSVHLGELSGSGTIQRAGATPTAPPLTVLTIGGKNTSSTYSGNITNIAEFAIDKVGSGALTLAGTNSHGGATTVSAGTLFINGSLANSAVTVESGATLGGTGSLGSSLTFDANSFLEVVDLSDALAVSGTVTFDSGFGIANLLGINWDDLDLNTPHTVLATTQTFGATDIANFGFDNRVAVGSSSREAYFTNGSLAFVVIPEPATALLGGLGLLMLLRRRRG